MNKNKETYYPSEENLGKECIWWNSNLDYIGCEAPKAEVQGRQSCEGIIDEVCLWLKDGKKTDKISEDEKLRLETTPPSIAENAYIPAEKY